MAQIVNIVVRVKYLEELRFVRAPLNDLKPNIFCHHSEYNINKIELKSESICLHANFSI